MTGATLTVTLDDAPVAAALRRLAGLTSNFEPLLKRIGVGLVDTTQERFREAKDPQGNAWAPLQPAYAQFKKGPGILREKAMRGGLMGSITFQVMGPKSVAVGSSKIYAGVHQLGAVIRPVKAKALVFRIGGRVIHAKTVKIPARPYLGMGEADRLVVMENVEFTLNELLAGD